MEAYVIQFDVDSVNIIQEPQIPVSSWSAAEGKALSRV